MKNLLPSLLIAFMALPAFAASTGVTINGTQLDDAVSDSGPGWAYDAATYTLTLDGAAPVTLSGQNTAGKVQVAVSQGVTSEVTLSNLTLVAASDNQCAFLLGSRAAMSLTLAGTNTLSSGSGRAGLNVPSNASLAITNAPGDDTAALSATGGYYGAGIGGGYYAPGGSVDISGGTVTATGGSYGAGIGGGNRGLGGTINISDGTVTATGGSYAAGIGGGSGGKGGTVTISGGKVTATGDGGGAGIGGGNNGANGNVTISGGRVTATGDGGGAGIGGGGNGANGNVTISGGTVFAQGGGSGGADIGPGGSGETTGFNIFTGGTIRLADASVVPSPWNNARQVFCTVVPNLAANQSVALAGLPATYGVNDVYADADGCIYLWLPNGTYTFTANDQTCTAEINESIEPSGVTVNGVDAYLSPDDPDTAGWRFDLQTRTVLLTGTGAFTISGTNVSGEVRVAVAAGVTNTVTLSNLTLKATGDYQCAFALETGANVSLFLAGANTLVSGKYRAGLGVAAGRALSITNAPGDDAAALSATGGYGAAGIGGGWASGGTVTLNGGSVTAQGGQYGAGIGGGGYGYGGNTTVNDGSVTAKGGQYGAGIGGAYQRSGGTTTINGGSVTATGGYQGAGIGGGYYGNGGNTTINGGSVTMQGGYRGAGIGGGDHGAGGTVTISGGTVTATGGQHGAGIGGGENGTGGTVTISGGEVEAAGGHYGAGIGGGFYGNGGTVTISGGTVTATGTGSGSVGGAGIGSGAIGDTASYTSGSVAISGGIVTATGGGDYAAGIGGGSGKYGTSYIGGANADVTVSGGTVFVHGGMNGYDIGPGCSNGTVSSDNTFTGGSIRLGNTSIVPVPDNGKRPVFCETVSGFNANDPVVIDGLGDYGINDIVADAEGSIHLWLPNGSYNFTTNGSVCTLNVWKSAIPETGVTVNGDEVAYGPENPDSDGWILNAHTRTVRLIGTGVFTLSGTNVSGDVSFAVAAGMTNTVTLSNLALMETGDNQCAFVVETNAHVSLVLVGTNSLASGLNRAGLEVAGGTLSITNAPGDDAASLAAMGFSGAGIGVESDENGDSGTVIINGGKITAIGDDESAGIGGGYFGDGGTVAINGGTVTAIGGGYAAGIGGGKYGGCGTVTVSGGTVTATGGENGAGIGGGESGTGGAITINGGMVTATGGEKGAGIGGGHLANGGMTTLSGGTVTATGGTCGAGIGGGYFGNGALVTLSGGTVTATGGEDAAGIGGGEYGDGGTVAISGGAVTATGGDYGAGIGGGNDGNGGTLAISGGTVFAQGGFRSTDTGPGCASGAGAGVLPGTNTFTGGSIRLGSSSASHVPSNNTEQVFCAMVQGFVPGSRIDITDRGNLPTDYGTEDIVADEHGHIYLWLPNGTCTFTADGRPRTVKLQNGVGPTGVRVNGEEVADGPADPAAGWNFDAASRTVALFGPGPFTLSGANVVGGVGVIVSNSVVNTVTLSNLTLRTTSEGRCVFSLWPGADVSLVLAGSNSLASGALRAGLEVVMGGTLSITNAPGDDAASLTAIGGDAAAGIGSFYYVAGGTVAVHGGKITAIGGEDGGAGIGGGYAGQGCTLTITGGEISAVGGDRGAGIGGGAYGDGGTVAISGGTVAAQGTEGGADIGPGFDGAVAGANTFTGGSIRLVNDAIAPAPSNATESVWCVTVTNLPPNTAVVVTALGAYGVNDLFADETGALYLWLPNDSYAFTAGGFGYTAAVDGAPTLATQESSGGLAAPVFAADGTALVFSGTTLAIKIANAQSGVHYTLYATSALGGDWELVESVCAENDGDLVFSNLDANAPARFFKVVASAAQP
ncbi:MAG: beta strand repeat-containing protein [Kiritimatiellia bacterium]|jgi:hypothetical protein